MSNSSRRFNRQSRTPNAVCLYPFPHEHCDNWLQVSQANGRANGVESSQAPPLPKPLVALKEQVSIVIQKPRWNLSEYSSPSGVLSASLAPWCVDRSCVIPSRLLNTSSQSAITDLVRHSDAIDDRKLFVSTVLMIWTCTRISDNNLVAWACPCVYLYYEGGPSCNRG